MRMPHTPYRWVVVALVAAAFLLALSEAHGQPAGGSTGAAGVFEGRPAMAGAQAGQGAQAGPPTGGIGVQDATPRKSLRDIVKPKGGDLAKPKPGTDIEKPKDRSLAGEQGGAVKKGAKGAKSSVRRSRTGVGEIGTRHGEGG